MYKSTEKRAAQIQRIVDEHYEEGRQDRCKKWVYRTIVAKQFGISERTFFRCLSRSRIIENRPAPIQYELQF